MRTSTVIFIALLGLCGPGRANERSDIHAIRLTAAEAAEVLALQSRHKITATYAAVMKNQACSQLRNTAESTDSQQIRQLAQQAIGAVTANDSAALNRLVQQLYFIEGPHGPAD